MSRGRGDARGKGPGKDHANPPTTGRAGKGPGNGVNTRGSEGPGRIGTGRHPPGRSSWFGKGPGKQGGPER